MKVIAREEELSFTIPSEREKNREAGAGRSPGMASPLRKELENLDTDQPQLSLKRM